MNRIISALVVFIAVATGCSSPAAVDEPTVQVPTSVQAPPPPAPEPEPTPELPDTGDYDEVLAFDESDYPNITDHISDAQDDGHSEVCTIDRDGADQNRDQAVAGHDTAEGMDRDEYPPAMCAEGGTGASIRLIDLSENRSAGAWMGNQLEPYPDGTVVLITVTP